MAAAAGDDHDETCRIDPLAPAQWGRDMSDDVKHAGRIGLSGDLDQLLDAQRIDVERSLKRRDGRVRIRRRDRSICRKTEGCLCAVDVRKQPPFTLLFWQGLSADIEGELGAILSLFHKPVPPSVLSGGGEKAVKQVAMVAWARNQFYLLNSRSTATG